MLRRDLVKVAGLVSRRGIAFTPKQSALVAPVLAQPSTDFSTSTALARSKFRHSRHHIPVLHELWRRREEVGPEKPNHRSELPNWNYDAELYAFCKRLNEDWKRETLIEAFTEKAYAEVEEERRAKLSKKSQTEETADSPASQSTTPVLCNVELAARGEELCRLYITAFLNHSLPAYPAEGVKSVCDFLVSDDLLGFVGQNMGAADLILTTDFPPAVKVFSNVVKALIAGLERDQGAKNAYLFIQDFVISQLSGRDINQFWDIVNPMGLLAETMKSGSGSKGAPEPRIIWQTGASTPLAAYKVGIYDSDTKLLLGTGGGETVMIAEANGFA